MTDQKKANIEFIVASRRDIERHLPAWAPYIVISISDPGAYAPRIRQNGRCQGVLRLQFHDAELKPGLVSPPENILMAGQQAMTIWRFIRTHLAHIRIIVVQCEADMCRSPAVAAAICRGLGGDDTEFWHGRLPNKHVYRLVLDALHVDKLGPQPSTKLATADATDPRISLLLGLIDDTVAELIIELVQSAIPGRPVGSVRNVASGTELREASSSGKFDLAVVTLNNLAAFSGYGATETDTEWLRRVLSDVQHLANAGVPTITFSGLEIPQTAQLSLEYGARSHFHIPFNAEDFIAAVRECLQ